MPYLVLGGLLSLPGLIPAIALNRGVDVAISEKGAMIYVFQRLPHHLVPHQFGAVRWTSYALLITITIILGAVYYRFPGHQGRFASRRAINSMVILSVMVGLFAVIGVCIDFGLSSWATNWSANLLRYYWFRWNDVVWPILIVLFTVGLLPSPTRPESYHHSEPHSLPASDSKHRGLTVWAVGLLLLPGTILIGQRYWEHESERFSPADKASLAVRSESKSNQLRLLNDWREVCAWAQVNSPEDSLWLTPRFQQTFKWYAKRSEVVCWKDSPQDAKGLIEWEKRLLDIFRAGPEGYGKPWSDEELKEFRQRYQCEYVLVDRRIQRSPPTLPLLFSNEHYAVFQYVDAMTDDDMKKTVTPPNRRDFNQPSRAK